MEIVTHWRTFSLFYNQQVDQTPTIQKSSNISISKSVMSTPLFFRSAAVKKIIICVGTTGKNIKRFCVKYKYPFK